MSVATLDIPADARVHLLPERFVDSPIGRADGSVARLAGGLLFHAGYRLIVSRDGRVVARHAIDASGWDDALAAMPAHTGRLSATARALAAARPAMALGERTIRFDQPQAMGILNLTPDSFSDGGRHVGDPEGAAATGVAMAAAGAAIIDVGGESTRPRAQTVWEGDEIARVVPVIERMARAGLAVSIDTRKAAVMEAALAAGAALVNDVAALAWDDRALEVVARAGCPVVLMHSPDPAAGPHGDMPPGDPALAVYDWLEARIDAIVAGGVDRARILVDTGIGFGKSLAHNLAILNALPLYHGLGCPLVLGASRKRIVGALSNEAPVDQRLGGSVALALTGADAGVQLLRVHDVAETAQALRVWRGLRDAALSAA